eukprot:m.248877 g.248877  ORF g.248877 m.248877 type:complete len:110 (+) comp40296_c1_seq28:166-495(+)
MKLQEQRSVAVYSARLPRRLRLYKGKRRSTTRRSTRAALACSREFSAGGIQAPEEKFSGGSFGQTAPSSSFSEADKEEATRAGSLKERGTTHGALGIALPLCVLHAALC